MWYVSTLLGLIRHAYWWGDKKWEKLSNLMPSSVTFHFSCCRKISLLQIIDSSSCVSEGRKDCYIHPQILQWYTTYFLKQECIRNVGFLSPFDFGIVTPSFDLSVVTEEYLSFYRFQKYFYVKPELRKCLFYRQVKKPLKRFPLINLYVLYHLLN